MSFEMQRLLREHAGEVVMELPSPSLAHASFEAALRGRRSVRRFNRRVITRVELGALLGLGAGATDDPPLPVAGMGPPGLRTYPSGGALYPIEVLTHGLAVEGLESGCHLYQVFTHRLVRFSRLEDSSAVEAMLHRNGIEAASLVFYLFVDFARPSLAKYGAKAHRLMLLEAGHIGQNLLLTASALGLASVALCGFDEERLSRSVGLAFPEQAIVYAIVIGGHDGG